MMLPGDMNSIDIGERLRVAREAAGITQADAAASLDFARTTLVAIEKGQRSIRAEEIQRLARLYGTSANALLRRESVHPDILPRFRKLKTTSDKATEIAASLMANLIRAEVELEELLGINRTHNYPPERPLMPGDVRVQAEIDAAQLRQWLGLGDTPMRDLVTLLELQLGVRVYVRPLDASIAGLFAYDDKCGACMLLNANHPRERRAQTAVHELGHFISARRTPELLHSNDQSNSREERYASSFGRAFLTPPRSTMQKFRDITAGSDRLTRRHVILLAHAFGVSREAIVRRLEELRLTKPGTWDWFQINGGITDESARRVLGDLATADLEGAEAARPTTVRLNLLAAEAWRQDLLSEGQLARLLHLDRVDLRAILDNIETEGSGADELPKLPR